MRFGELRALVQSGRLLPWGPGGHKRYHERVAAGNLAAAQRLRREYEAWKRQISRNEA